MCARPKESQADRLTAAQIAIDNSLSDDEIQARVAEYGYPVAKLTAGKTLYTAALNAVGNAESAAGAQKLATDHVESAEQIARDAFQALAKVCRAAFSDEPAQLTALQLDGKTPRSTAAFLTTANILFQNALGTPEIQTTLAEYGYTAQKLQTECAKITSFSQANESQEAAKGAAQQATVVQNNALAELDDWMARYIKIAQVALRDEPQLLEKLGILSRSSKTAAQLAQRRKKTTTSPTK